MQSKDIQVLLKVIIIYIFFYLLIFLPAGTLTWFDGWLFIGILTVYAIVLGVYLLIKRPGTLQSRDSVIPKTSIDKIIVLGTTICFFLILIIPGYDVYYLKFSNVPSLIKTLASLVFILTLVFLFFVIRENPFASRVVEVQKGQKVIDTGPYRYIRHPMYAGMMLMFNCIPLMLGSYLALIFSLIISINIFIRIFDEEKHLEKDLPGYIEYKQKVRYRLIPKLY